MLPHDRTAARCGAADLSRRRSKIEGFVDKGGYLPHLLRIATFMAQQRVGAGGALRHPDIGVQACQHPGEYKHLLWLFEEVPDRRGLDLLDPEDHTGMGRCDIPAVLPDPPPQITEKIKEHQPGLRALQGCDPAKKIVTRLYVHQSVELIPKLSVACSRSGCAHGSPLTSYCLPSIISREQLSLRISRGEHWGVGPADGEPWGW